MALKFRRMEKQFYGMSKLSDINILKDAEDYKDEQQKPIGTPRMTLHFASPFRPGTVFRPFQGEFEGKGNGRPDDRSLARSGRPSGERGKTHDS
jgi:hypothetical protein